MIKLNRVTSDLLPADQAKALINATKGSNHANGLFAAVAELHTKAYWIDNNVKPMLELVSLLANNSTEDAQRTLKTFRSALQRYAKQEELASYLSWKKPTKAEAQAGMGYAIKVIEFKEPVELSEMDKLIQLAKNVGLEEALKAIQGELTLSKAIEH